MKLSAKEMLENVDIINMAAKMNFDVAQGMLSMLNKLCGTDYDFLNKRVIEWENPNKKFGAAHDLHAELWYEVEYGSENEEA